MSADTQANPFSEPVCLWDSVLPAFEIINGPVRFGLGKRVSHLEHLPAEVAHNVQRGKIGLIGFEPTSLENRRIPGHLVRGQEQNLGLLFGGSFRDVQFGVFPRGRNRFLARLRPGGTGREPVHPRSSQDSRDNQEQNDSLDVHGGESFLPISGDRITGVFFTYRHFSAIPLTANFPFSDYLSCMKSWTGF